MRTIPLAHLIEAAGKRSKGDSALPVYSVTKHSGFVPSLEYFKKQVFSRDTKGYREVEAGDFAYATIHLDEGSIGIAPEPALISPMYTVFRADNDRVDSGYLIRYLKSPAAMARYDGMGRGAVHRRKAISLDALGALPIPLPPPGEQRRIAAILDQADALRAKRRQVLAHLDALPQAIFHEMFRGLKTTAVLGDVAEVQGGLQVSRKRALLPETVPYLRVANAFRGYLDLSEIKTLQATEAEIARVQLMAGDLLLVEGHANPLEVGRAALWEGQLDRCVHQNHLIRARPDTDSTLPEFLLAWLNSPSGAYHFRRAGKTTSGLNTISTSTVRTAPVVVPPLEQQRHFVASVARVGNQRSILETALRHADELFGSLQSRAFRGEL